MIFKQMRQVELILQRTFNYDVLFCGYKLLDVKMPGIVFKACAVAFLFK